MEIRDIQVGLTYTSGDDTIEVLRKKKNIWGHPIFACLYRGDTIHIPAVSEQVSTWREANTINN